MFSFILCWDVDSVFYTALNNKLLRLLVLSNEYYNKIIIFYLNLHGLVSVHEYLTNDNL